MEKRTGDTPMDYEYDNKSGPISSGSPFPKGDPNKRGFGSTMSNGPDLFRSSSLFNSAQIPPSTLPKTPIKTCLTGFRENPENAMDFSSGAEAQSSPDNADNEDTPDVPKVSDILGEKVTVFRGSKPSPAKRQSFFSSLPGRLNPSQYYKSSRPLHGRELSRRVHKRKRREFDEDNRLARRQGHGSSGSDWDSRPSSSEGQHAAGGGANSAGANTSSTTPFTMNPAPQDVGLIPAFFAFLHRHPDLPVILSNYGQTLLGWFVTFTIIAFVYGCWSVVRSDVEMAVQEATAEIVREIARCSESFHRNGCGSERGPPPALVATCHEWNECINRDPLLVGKAQVGAQTFSRIMNGFFEQMSWKFLTFIIATMLIMCLAPSQIFGHLRRQSQQMHPEIFPHPSSAVPPPPTPQQHQGYMQSPPPLWASKGGLQQQAYFTPAHQQAPRWDAGGTGAGAVGYESQSPSRDRGRTPGGAGGRERESPVRRIGYI